MSKIELVSNVKKIGSGQVPTTTNLLDGNIAFGEVGGKNKIYGNVGNKIVDLTSEGTYTNSTPTTSALGGIAKGETFENLSFTELFNKLLYPYVALKVTATSTPNGGVYEKGSTQTVTKITANLIKGSAKIVKVEALNGAMVLQTKTSEDFGTSTVTFEINVGITTGKSLSVKVTDSENKSYLANTGSFLFVYPYYYGVVNDGVSVDEATVKGLTKLVQTQSTKTLYFNANNQKMVFASPYKVSSITDANGFSSTDTFIETRVSITCLDNTVQSYYVYTANKATTVSNFKMTFTN